MTEPTRWGHLQDDDMDGDTYGERLAEFNASVAEYVRATRADGCCCEPFPGIANAKRISHWCREHGVLSVVPAELTWSNPGVRGGEPCMTGTRVPVEEVADLLQNGATWDFVKETYPSIPTPAPETPRQPAESSPEPPTGPERGTGEAGPETATQAVEGLANEFSPTLAEIAAWASSARRETDAAHFDVRTAVDRIAYVMRPIHYREVADSLDRLGHHDAARAVRSTAKDLTEGAPE
jgi:hypothetical protein